MGPTKLPGSWPIGCVAFLFLARECSTHECSTARKLFLSPFSGRLVRSGQTLRVTTQPTSSSVPTQAPTQPLDGATRIISSYIVDVSVGSPMYMSDWLQTFVNTPGSRSSAETIFRCVRSFTFAGKLPSFRRLLLFVPSDLSLSPYDSQSIPNTEDLQVQHHADMERRRLM